MNFSPFRLVRYANKHYVRENMDNKVWKNVIRTRQSKPESKGTIHHGFLDHSNYKHARVNTIQDFIHKWVLLQWTILKY